MKDNLDVVLKYIDEHICETITLSELAKIAGYSEYYFSGLFKSNMNVSVMEYVCRRKLIKASEDILAGEKIISTAMKYGWQSHSGFTKAYNREFGFSPSLLRVMKIELENLGGNAMNYVVLESPKVGTTKEALFKLLQKRVRTNGIDIEDDLLLHIYRNACDAYAGVKRYSGEEYVTHLLNVSLILAELGAERNVVLAGMFCDVFQKGKVTLESLSKSLPKEVYDLITKVQKADTDFAIADDEVVLIKLAERLHNMRTIEYIDGGKKKEKAKETVEWFIPLARRLENKKLMDELNELSARYC